MRPVGLLTFTALVMLAVPVRCDDYIIDTENSIFAIVTHKAGMMARLAHNHLIPAVDYEAELSVEDGDLSTCAFRIEFPVENLMIADEDEQDRWYPQLEAAGILDEALEKTSLKNREKIRKGMLSRKQLDARRYPTISAVLAGLRPAAAEAGEETLGHIATLDVTIHDETRAYDFPARIVLEGETLRVEVHGPLNFTDFGMKPYSALAGAIRNRDRFDLYVNITATRKAEV